MLSSCRHALRVTGMLPEVQTLRRFAVDAPDRPTITEQLKQAATTVSNKVSDMMGNAKEMVQDSTERAREEKDHMKDRLQEGTNRAQGKMEEMGNRIADKANSMADRAQHAAENAAGSDSGAVGAATGTAAEANDPQIRGKTNVVTAAGGIGQEPVGAMAAGLGRTGTFMNTDKEGVKSSNT